MREAKSAKAIADEVIDKAVIPKKLPALDDIDSQIKAISGALASALLTATEMPLHMLQPVVGDLAAQLVALGIRQTDLIQPDAIHAPAWITDGIKQSAIRIPEPPQHTDGQPYIARTCEAPRIPKKIPKGDLATRLEATAEAAE